MSENGEWVWFNYCERRYFRALHIFAHLVQKFDVSENYYHYKAKRINWYVRKKINLANMPPIS